MLITRIKPTGIDWYIQELQTRLHDVLVSSSFLNIADQTKYKAYGRCYRDKKENGYIAENYEGASEYKELYWDDSLSMISFFGINNRPIEKGIKNTADVHLVFFADLEKLAIKNSDGDTIAHRADEELRGMVASIIGKFSNGFTYQSTELWLENVLREYAGSYRDERLKTVDMHPVHCFRINLKLIYNENKNC
jgi:hypothetical protein